MENLKQKLKYKSAEIIAYIITIIALIYIL